MYRCRSSSSARRARMKTNQLLLTALALTLTAFGQSPPSPATENPTGILEDHVYQGNSEKIDLATGNLTVNIPLLSLPGRNGHNLVLTASYNSKNWYHWSYTNPFNNITSYYWIKEVQYSQWTVAKIASLS